MAVKADEIPWEFVIFVALIAIALFYFVFIQSYLSALILRGFLHCFMRNLKVVFKRSSFSPLSGHFSVHNVRVITTDMRIVVRRITARWMYWRRIPLFLKDEKNETRLRVNMEAVEITIYNRAWTTGILQNVISMYNEGKTTQEVTNYLRDMNIEPEPNVISFLWNIILPMSFKIRALIVTIGNPKLPSSLIFTTKKIYGKFTILAREDQTHHMKQFLTLEMIDVNFRSEPKNFLGIAETEGCMRHLFQRSRQSYEILSTGGMKIEMLKDMYGCYTHHESPNAPTLVTALPEFKLNVTFDENEQTHMVYGPYVDKLRAAFQKFFTPFMYNNPQYFPDNMKRVKYMEIDMSFPKGVFVDMPFVTNDMQFEHLYMDFQGEGRMHIVFPQFISNAQENKMHIQAEMKNFNIASSISPVNFLSTDTFLCSYVQSYPEKWNDVMNVVMVCQFADCLVCLAPYYIDFLTHFSQDWVAPYPFPNAEEGLSTFKPAEYFVTLQMSPFRLQGLSKVDCPFEGFNDIPQHPHIDLRSEGFIFKIAIPNAGWNPKSKVVSYSGEFSKSGLGFMWPPNDIHAMRRAPEVVSDHLLIDSMGFSGSYAWVPGVQGNVQNLMSMRISDVGGLMTIHTLQDLLEVIKAYTTAPKIKPSRYAQLEGTEPVRPFITNNHSSVTIQVDSLSVKVPWDLYETHNCMELNGGILLIGVEGYYPFWHADVNIDALHVEIPTPDFPGDRFYAQNLGDPSDGKSGTVHADGFSIKVRSIQSQEPGVNVSNTIDLQIGSVGGFVTLPTLYNILEFVQNFLFYWNGDEAKERHSWEPKLSYSLSCLRVGVATSSVFLDFGRLGLLSASLPAGVIVYNDNLIDKTSNSIYHIEFPIIDAVFLNAMPDGTLRALLRATTFFNIVMQMQYPQAAFHQTQQGLFIRKANHGLHLFDFVDLDALSVDESIIEKPDIYFPEKFKLPLTETFTLYQSYRCDPRNKLEYSLPVPSIDYQSMHEFITFDVSAMWMHKMHVSRCYTHVFPHEGRRMSTFTGTALDPSSDGFVYPDRTVTLNLIVPNELFVQLRPRALEPIIAALKVMSLKPDCQMMASYTRKLVSKETSVQDTATKYVIVALPNVSVSLEDETFKVLANLSNFSVFFANEVRNEKTRLTIEIEGVTAKAMPQGNDDSSLSVSIPTLQIVSDNGNTAIKATSDFVVDFNHESAELVSDILSKLVEGAGTIGSAKTKNRTNQLHRVLKAYELFADEKYKCQKILYNNCKHPRVSRSVQADITAMYLAKNRLGINNFVDNYSFFTIPPKTKEIVNSQLIVMPISLQIRGQHVKEESKVEIHLLPLRIQREGEHMAVVCGVSSASINISTEILDFLNVIKPPKLPKAETQVVEKKPAKANKRKFTEVQVVVRDISAQFGPNITANMSSFAATISKGPDSFLGLAAIDKVIGTVREHAKIEWHGLQWCLRQETSVGIIRVGPLYVTVSVDLLLSPFEILGFTLPKKTKTQKKKSARKKTSTEINKFLEQMSVTVLVGEVKLCVRASESLEAITVMPGFSGLGYSHDHVSYQFGHIKGLNLEISGAMQTSLPDTLVQGSFNHVNRELWMFIMWGDLQWKTDRRKMLQVVPALNDILMRISAKKPKALDAKQREKPKNNSGVLSPTKRRISDQLTGSKMKVQVQFLMPQMSFEIEDIQSKIEVKAPFGMIEIGKEIVWRFNMEEITLHIFDLRLFLVAQVSAESGVKRVLITEFGVALPKDFVPKLQRFKTFFEYIREQTKSQNKVDALLQNINTQIQHSVEKGAAEVLETITKQMTDDLEFPDITSSTIFVQIFNVHLAIELEGGGKFQTQILEADVLVKSRISEIHDEKARALKFDIYDLKVQLDSEESGVSGSSDPYTGSWFNDDANLSMLSCKLISLQFVSFNNRFDGSATVDSLKIEIFPTLPFALAHLYLLTKPRMAHPRRRSAFYVNTAAALDMTGDIDEEKPVEAPVAASGRMVFKLLNSEIVLSPVSNVLPLHSVAIDCTIHNSSLQATLVVDQTIVIALTPRILEWSLVFQKSLVDAIKLAKRPIVPVSPKAEKTRRKQKQKVKMAIKIAASIQLIELRFSCAPTKSDLAFAAGVTSLHVMGSVNPHIMSARVGQIYLRTENERVPVKSIGKTDRLFEFIVPSIDALISPRKIVSQIDSVTVSVSSDKIDEVSLFMDIWVYAVLERLKQGRSYMLVRSKAPKLAKKPQPDTNAVIEIQVRELNVNLSYAAGIGNIHLAVLPVNVTYSSDYDGTTIGQVKLTSEGHVDGAFTINSVAILRTKVEDSFSRVFHIQDISSELKIIDETIFVFSLDSVILAAQRFEKGNSVMFHDIFVSLGNPLAKGCSQAVTALSQLIHNLVDPLKEKIQLSRASVETQPRMPPKPPIKPVLNAVLPMAQLTLVTENVEVDLFKYYFSDKDAAFVKIESALLRLKTSQNGNTKERVLRMELNPSLISRLSIQGKARENRVVLQIPKMTGDLKTKETDARVRYDFITQFDGALEPSLTLTDYEVIIGIIKYVVTQIVMSVKKDQPQEEAKDKEKEKPPKKHPKFTFEPGKYEFNPGIKVGIGAAVNPDIKWVLSRLNISDEHLIPSSLFEYLCLTLEKLIITVSSKMPVAVEVHSDDEEEEL